MATRLSLITGQGAVETVDPYSAIFMIGTPNNIVQGDFQFDELATVPAGLRAFASGGWGWIHGDVASVESVGGNGVRVTWDTFAAGTAGVENNVYLCFYIPEALALPPPGPHDYKAYLTEVESKIQDESEKLEPADRKAALAAAVTKYGSDIGFSFRKRVAGNGTSDYLLTTILGTDWHPGLTQITDIEYPEGEKPATMLDPFEDFSLYDDGTVQTGANIKLRFADIAPGAAEHFVVQFTVPMVLPEFSTANFADNDKHFSAITTLAAAYCCERLAAAFAQSSDSTITADVIDYHDKSGRYQALARQYFERYNLSVFGSKDGSGGAQAAVVEREIDTRTMEGSAYLFHGRNR